MMISERLGNALLFIIVLFAIVFLFVSMFWVGQTYATPLSQLEGSSVLMQWTDKWGKFAYTATGRKVTTQYRDAEDVQQHFTFEPVADSIYKIKSLSKNTYLTDPGTGNWSYIHLAASNNTDQQKWRVIPISGNIYKIQSLFDASQYLFSWGSYPGGEMGTHAWQGWDSQHIILKPLAAPPTPAPPPSGQCSDGVKNNNESDVDCGGSCAGCNIGKVCREDSDCQSVHCDNGTCTQPDGGGRSPYVPDGYTLRFNDEFESDSLDLTEDGQKQWATRFVGWNCMSLYGNSDDALKVHEGYRGTDGKPMGTSVHDIGNGTLKLYGKKLPAHRRPAFWGYPYTSGMISGELNFSQTYGYWETRVKLDPVSQGHHWAIWLLPQNGEWPPEVDMLEVVGLNPDQFSSCFHYNDANGEHKGDIVFYDAPNGAGGWHTFGFLWTPKEMMWYVNGVLKKTQATTYMPAIPHYFLVTLEIASNWPGDPDHTTVWPAKAEVDYVRIYQQQ